MRLVLALSIFAASALGAHAAEDRYGPPRVRTSAPAGPQTTPTGAMPASGSPYAGQMLSWGGKAPEQTPQQTLVASAPQTPQMPQAVSPWAGPAVGSQRPLVYPSTAAPVQTPMPVAYAPPPAARPVAPPPTPVAAQPLPTSLYDRAPAPAPSQAPAQAAAPTPYQPPVYARPAYQPPAPQAPPQAQAQAPVPAPAPQQFAALPPVQQPTQPYQPPRSQTASLPPAPSAPQPIAGPEEARPRAYSVVREFGGVPDPINIPPPTSYWATRPETAPPPEEADTGDFATAGGVGAEEVAAADGPTPEEASARRREQAKADARAAAAAAAKSSGKGSSK